jgi:hypothetical protein
MTGDVLPPCRCCSDEKDDCRPAALPLLFKTTVTTQTTETTAVGAVAMEGRWKGDEGASQFSVVSHQLSESVLTTDN